MANQALRNVRIGAKSLLLHRMRSLLTMLGVVFGVAAVIAMLAVGEGASRDAMSELNKLGSRNIILSSQKAVQDEGTSTVRTRMAMYGLDYEDELRIAESFPRAVRRTVPVKEVRKRGMLGGRTLDLLIVGTTAEWFELVDRPVLAGRVLTEVDSRGAAAVVVLTEHGARRLLATRATIGEHVRIGGESLEVVGIVQSATSSSAEMPDSEVDAYIPIHVSRERFGDIAVDYRAGSRVRERVELHRLIVEMSELDQVERTARGIRSMMDRFHPKGDVDVYVPLALLRQAEAQQRIWNWTLGSIAGISLIVGGIGIMNIMLSSVTERTREIGIRRALGARKRHIVTQFLTETILLSGLGGLIGTIVGPALAFGIEAASGMSAVVPLYSVVLSVGISVTIGIGFGIYPAARAAELDPILALRHE